MSKNIMLILDPAVVLAQENVFYIKKITHFRSCVRGKFITVTNAQMLIQPFCTGYSVSRCQHIGSHFSKATLFHSQSPSLKLIDVIYKGKQHQWTTVKQDVLENRTLHPERQIDDLTADPLNWLIYSLNNAPKSDNIIAPSTTCV